MKPAKLRPFLLAVSILSGGWITLYGQQNVAHSAASDTARAATALANEPVKFVNRKDPNTGLIQYRSPVPQSWSVHDITAPVYMSSARGVSVLQAENAQFAWSNDPFMQQTIQMTGANLGRPMSLQQILEAQIRPNAESQGYRLLGTQPAPGVAGLWQRLFAAMPNNGNRRSAEALVTDWANQDGTRSMILMVKTETRSAQSMAWQIQTTELQAPQDHYEDAKAAYLYAVAATELNPDWIAASNRALARSTRSIRQYWDNASQISRSAHRQRMQAIEDRGASARSVADTYSDILDISHKGYLSRDSLNDAGHARSVDLARGTTLIGNRETGEFYDVEGSNQHYWVNQDGLYIGTDNPLFDPRLEPLTQEEQWTRFHAER